VSLPLPIVLYLVSECYCHFNTVNYLNGRNLVGHVACMEGKRNAYELLVSKTEGKRSLEAKSGNIEIQRNGVCVDWTQLANNRHHDRQLSGSTEGREFEDVTVSLRISRRFEGKYCPHLQGSKGPLYWTACP
jgi:hypothetical protein